MLVSDDALSKIGDVLLDTQRPLKERFRALFTLRNLGGQLAIDFIASGFRDSSALLKHECAYCLGQMLDDKAIEVLQNVLEDSGQEPIVRHEAGEALGAIGSQSCLDILNKYVNDPIQEIAETCDLAIRRIKWLHSTSEKDRSNLTENPYLSTDPTPPRSSSSALASTQIPHLKKAFLDIRLSMYDRYRAMFSLRNLGTREAVLALCEGFKCGESALFRHEIAFVLGQIQSEDSVSALIAVLKNLTETGMVRHECAEALGSIGNNECMAVLRDYLHDKERLVRESCEVALDMCDYENSKEFQYADTLDKVHD